MKKIVFTLLFSAISLFGVSSQKISFFLSPKIGGAVKISAPLFDCRKECKEISKWKMEVPNRILKKIYSETKKVLEKKNYKVTRNKRTKFSITLEITNLKSEFRIVQSRKDKGFNLLTDIALDLKLKIFEDGKIDKEFLERVDNISLIKNITATYFNFDSKYKKLPTPVDGKKEFGATLEKEIAPIVEKLVSDITKVDKFRTLKKVVTFNSDLVIFEKTKDDEVRVDAPLFFQVKGGDEELHTISWGKVRDVNLSKAEVLEGTKKIENINYTFFPVWSGMMYGVSGGIEMKSLESGSTSLASLMGYKISGDFALDLGFLLNYKYLSEVWLTGSIFTALETSSIDYSEHINKLDSNYFLGGEIGLEYRKYIHKFFRKPIFAYGGASFGATISEYDIGYYNSVNGHSLSSSGTLSLLAYYMKFRFGAGYSLSQDIEFFGDLSYSLQVGGDSSLEENGKVLASSEIDYFDSKDIQYGGDLEIRFGARISY